MAAKTGSNIRVAIACGGTGGHLFPGIAIAGELIERGCSVTLLISPKEVDQVGVRTMAGAELVTLPAVGLTRGGAISFVQGFIKSFSLARKAFKLQKPQIGLAMGGFISAAPMLALRANGKPIFLHESNTIPGRANRWLSWLAKSAFIGFPSAANRLRTRNIVVTGTPVRAAFRRMDQDVCRKALGLDPARPVVLVMGGSQGATGINEIVGNALKYFAKHSPSLQWIHLTGPNDVERVKAAYSAAKLNAIIHASYEAMELLLGAASAAISRAGASSLAELAAVRVPAILVPFPAATDDHQRHNARAFEQTGAARLLEQHEAEPEVLGPSLMEILEQPEVFARMTEALSVWHTPRAAEQIVDILLEGRQRTISEPGRAGCDRSPPNTQRLPSAIA
jgi:UDP-N-acetylglucosamine--N-acetylmuramyl-(pentapeptide) pyrophosphoryl-undecaprenol N-acetylglucosamine transferase